MKKNNNLKKISISVVVPAYNEEKNLSAALKNLINALKGNVKEYEIIIFDDNSKDKTGKIADSLAAKNKRIKVIHNRPNKGFGYNCITGYKMASKEYCTLFPGDNENSGESISDMIKLIGKTEIITSYTINNEVRSFKRRVISDAFTNILNIVFRLKLKYYNGITIYPTKILKHLEVKTHSFAFNAEIMTKLIKSGHTYFEYGIKINPTKKTNIFKIKNIFSVMWAVLGLFYEVYIKNRKKYSH